MKRRSDRGNVAGLLAIAAIITLVGLLLLMLVVGGKGPIHGKSLREREVVALERIADAVCIYAPPAEPAEEVTDGD